MSSGCGIVNGWWAGIGRPVVVERLEQREVDDPQEVQAALVHRRAARARAAACPSTWPDRAAARRRRAAAGRPASAPSASTTPSCSASLTGTWPPGESSVAVRRRPASTPGPWRPSDLARSASSSSSRGRSRRPARHADALDRIGAWNALNSVAANTSVELDQLHAEAHVGLVGAVALHGLVPGHPRDRPRPLRR